MKSNGENQKTEADGNYEGRVKYPRTYHFPFSPGLKNDDRVLESMNGWEGRDVIITEKMDGENTTFYRDGLHARSLDFNSHPSREHIKAIHAQIAHEIPEDYRISGENLTAVHSIRYENLPSYFLVFGIWRGDFCLSWDNTLDWCALLGLHTVPLLYRGPFSEAQCRELCERLDTERQEGVVVRPAAGFLLTEFPAVVGKWVRTRHIQTDEHWMKKEVEFNGLQADTK